jgi:hypothetical protein
VGSERRRSSECAATGETRRHRPFVEGQALGRDADPQRAADCLRGWAPSPFHRGLWASGKARHKPDQIATIVQSLIIDWPIAGGKGRPLDQEDRAAGRHLERLGGNRFGRGPLPACIQPRPEACRTCSPAVRRRARPRGRSPQPSPLARAASMSRQKTPPHRRPSEHAGA